MRLSGAVITIFQSYRFSLYRKDSLTSGLALKSRATNFFGKKQAASKKHGAPTHEINLEDIGVNILIAHNVESSKENIMFLFEADVLDNAKVFTRTPYSIMQNLLTLVSIVQLTSVHISRDKHLTVLLTNQPNSKIEGVLRWDSEDFSQNSDVEEKKVMKLDFSLLHLLDFNDPHPKQLHKWEFASKYSTLKNSRASKAVMSLNRKAIDGDKWKVSLVVQALLGGDNFRKASLEAFDGLKLRDAKAFFVGHCGDTILQILSFHSMSFD